MSNVKVYGIERSGNNWLQWLLTANYKVKVLPNKTGWTHGPIAINSGADLNLIISKHPIEWLPSMHKYEKSRISRTQYLSKLLKWNNLYKSYLKDAPENTEFIRYDALLLDTEGVLSPIAKKYNLLPKEGEFRTTDCHMNKKTIPSKRPFNKEYYTKKEYVFWYHRGILNQAQNLVDWDVANKLGYEKI